MTAFAALQSGYRELLKNSSIPLDGGINLLIYVSIAEQTLSYYSKGRLAARYPVSTAASGAGCTQGSGCTPFGWHVVQCCIGSNESMGSIFKGRLVTGVARSLCDTSADDLITSRILWLKGLEAGVNLDGDVDSFSRYIYIHGTAQEHLIGMPVSHGCIRMRNRDVIELFDQVAAQTPVYISR